MASIQPELWVDRAAAAVAFYRAAFGATVQHQVGEGDDIVAQLAIGDASFWVASGGAGGPRFSPRAIGGATGRTLLVADDPDATFGRGTGAPRHMSSFPRRRLVKACTKRFRGNATDVGADRHNDLGRSPVCGR